MNPLTNIRNLTKLTENEIKLGTVGTSKSWHNQYRDSAWVFFGGMPFELTEGDIICIFEQYGSIVNINLIRDKKTGKSKGFGFICYENQLSTDLAVDNFNGTQIIGRVIKVDHVANYKPPKDHDDADEVTRFLREEGCATKVVNEKKEIIPAAFVKPTDSKKENRLDDFKDEKEVVVKKEKLSSKDDSFKSKKSRHRSRSRSSSAARSSSSSSRSRSAALRRRDYSKRSRSQHERHRERDRERDRQRDRDRDRRDRDRDRERSDRDRDYKRRH